MALNKNLMQFLSIGQETLSASFLGYSFLLMFFRYSTYELNNQGESLIELMISTALFFLRFRAKNLSIGLTACQLALCFNINRKYVKGKTFNPIDLNGKVFIVTGSNTGIGFETTKSLIQMNGIVIMACRSIDKANEARDQIIKETGCPPSKLIVLKLDLCNFDSVRNFVKDFKNLGLPLNCLINNAGLMTDKRQATPSGLEMVFTSNHLSHFLLTNLLLSDIEKTNGRIVNVTSSVHNVAKSFNFDDLMTENRVYEMFDTYSQSKLANILFTKELQKRLIEKGSKVKCFSVHPGCVRTEVTRHMNWWMQLGNNLAAPIMLLLQKTPPQGAYCSLYCATNPELELDERYQGQYFMNCRLTKSSPASYDIDSARRLWEVSEKITGLSN